MKTAPKLNLTTDMKRENLSFRSFSATEQIAQSLTSLLITYN